MIKSYFFFVPQPHPGIEIPLLSQPRSLGFPLSVELGFSVVVVNINKRQYLFVLAYRTLCSGSYPTPISHKKNRPFGRILYWSG